MANEVEPLYKTDEDKEKPLCTIKYIQYRAMSGFTSREFLEKHINFADKSEGRYYVYFSAVPSLENTDPEAIDISCISENGLNLLRKPVPSKSERG
jgi:hypothetical protein